MFSYFINAAFAQAVYNWRWMLFAGVLPGLILFVGMCLMSDTPRWLVSKNRDYEAKNVFKKIEPDVDVEKEIGDIKSTLQSEGEGKQFRFKKWMIMAAGHRKEVKLIDERAKKTAGVYFGRHCRM